MWIKLAGAGTIIFGAVILGRRLSQELVLRRDSLSEFYSALIMLESEITFSQNSIAGAFDNISKSIPLSGFFAEVSRNTAEYGIREAWNGALDKYGERLGLKLEDIGILRSLSAELGITDRDNQIKNIRYVLSRLLTVREEAAERCSTLSRLFRGVCTLTGIGIAILLM